MRLFTLIFLMILAQLNSWFKCYFQIWLQFREDIRMCKSLPIIIDSAESNSIGSKIHGQKHFYVEVQGFKGIFRLFLWGFFIDVVTPYTLLKKQCNVAGKPTY